MNTQLTLQLIEQDFAEALNYDDVSLATAVSMQLQKLLKNKGQDQEISKNAPRLQRMVILADFIRLPALGLERVTELFQNNLLEAFNIPNYDLTEKLRKFLVFIELDELRIQTMGDLNQALLNNQERFGNEDIVVGGVKIAPLLGNWVKQYDQFPTQNIRRGNIDTLNFMSKFSGVSTLSEARKKQLLEILKIYDSLKNRVSEYRSLPENAKVEEAFKNFDLSLMLPGITAELPKGLSGFEALFNAPKQAQANAPSGLPKKAIDEGVDIKPATAASVKQDSPTPAPTFLQKPPIKPAPKVPAAPARVEFAEADPYKTGLRLSGHGSAPVSMDTIKAGMEKKKQEEIERQKRQEQRINQKLDELKKKVKN